MKSFINIYYIILLYLILLLNTSCLNKIYFYKAHYNKYNIESRNADIIDSSNNTFSQKGLELGISYAKIEINSIEINSNSICLFKGGIRMNYGFDKTIYIENVNLKLCKKISNINYKIISDLGTTNKKGKFQFKCKYESIIYILAIKKEQVSRLYALTLPPLVGNL